MMGLLLKDWVYQCVCVHTGFVMVALYLLRAYVIQGPGLTSPVEAQGFVGRLRIKRGRVHGFVDGKHVTLRRGDKVCASCQA